MKCCDQITDMFDQHWVALIFCQNVYSRSRSANNRSPNEDCLDIPAAGALRKILPRSKGSNPAIDLATVRIPRNRQVDRPEALLRRVFHFFRDKNGAGTGPKNRCRARNLSQELF